jgi:hypothetical protein
MSEISMQPVDLISSGYLHQAYAESLSEFGVPRLLPLSGGWLLERQIPNSGQVDAVGCYPFFACQDWHQLHADLANISKGLVSLSVVTDPFGEYNQILLNRCFPDLAVPFKQHFVVDLRRQPEQFVHSHHLRNARKALNVLRVEACDDPSHFLDDWVVLYANLIARHKITGLTAFSRESFAKQLRVPGIVMLRAVCEDTTVGILLWYVQGNRAYYHLGAYTIRGYEIGASFALFDYAIRYFCSQQFKWLNLGAGAGTGTGESGLTRFKKGWSTDVRTAYFCGRIFDRQKYQQLVEATNTHATDYFPAYRLGEFK